MITNLSVSASKSVLKSDDWLLDYFKAVIQNLFQNFDLYLCKQNICCPKGSYVETSLLAVQAGSARW